MHHFLPKCGDIRCFTLVVLVVAAYAVGTEASGQACVAFQHSHLLVGRNFFHRFNDVHRAAACVRTIRMHNNNVEGKRAWPQQRRAQRIRNAGPMQQPCDVPSEQIQQQATDMLLVPNQQKNLEYFHCPSCYRTQLGKSHGPTLCTPAWPKMQVL
jgi:hypothetical protein